MRITDCRYDRDRLRLAVAYRLIGHEVRTQTIRCLTWLSDDRIRRLWRDYWRSEARNEVRRRRGKAPRQMTYFRKSADHEIEAATFACLLAMAGLIGAVQSPWRPTLDQVSCFLDVYETFCCDYRPSPFISCEHGLFLFEVLNRAEEYALLPCPGCSGLWVRDQLSVQPDRCAACRSPLLPF